MLPARIPCWTQRLCYPHAPLPARCPSAGRTLSLCRRGPPDPGAALRERAASTGRVGNCDGWELSRVVVAQVPATRMPCALSPIPRPPHHHGPRNVRLRTGGVSSRSHRKLGGLRVHAFRGCAHARTRNQSRSLVRRTRPRIIPSPSEISLFLFARYGAVSRRPAPGMPMSRRQTGASSCAAHTNAHSATSARTTNSPTTLNRPGYARGHRSPRDDVPDHVRLPGGPGTEFPPYARGIGADVALVRCR
jgi:hypothetical protein